MQDVGKKSEAESIFNYSELVAKYQFTGVKEWQNLTAYNSDFKDYIIPRTTLLKYPRFKPINRGSKTYELSNIIPL